MAISPLDSVTTYMDTATDRGEKHTKMCSVLKRSNIVWNDTH